MTLSALLFSILFGTAALAYGYHLVGAVLFARGIVLSGLAWFLAIWQRWRWFAYLGLACILLASALGLWLLNLSPGWMFAGAIGGLLAFDLSRFSDRLRYIAPEAERRALERRHLARISILTLAGMTLAGLAALVKKQFSVEWAALSAAVGVLALVQLALWFRRRG